MTRFTRRALLAATAALALPLPAFAKKPPPANLTPADQAMVAKAVAYLDDLVQVKGRFTQTDERGRTATGDFYLKRPGKVRFAYDPPNDRLVVSDGGRISIQDKRLQTFQQYPLGLSPLSLFLAKHVRLDRGVKVAKVTAFSDGFAITAFDGGHETDGQVSLVFADGPMRLKEWTVIDAQGGHTRIELADLAPAPGLDPNLFVLLDPRGPAIKGPHG